MVNVPSQAIAALMGQYARAIAQIGMVDLMRVKDPRSKKIAAKAPGTSEYAIHTAAAIEHQAAKLLVRQPVENKRLDQPEEGTTAPGMIAFPFGKAIKDRCPCTLKLSCKSPEICLRQEHVIITLQDDICSGALHARAVGYQLAIARIQPEQQDMGGEGIFLPAEGLPGSISTAIIYYDHSLQQPTPQHGIIVRYGLRYEAAAIQRGYDEGDGCHALRI